MVNEFYIPQILQVAADGDELTRAVTAFVQLTFQGTVENITYQGTFAGSADTGHHGHYIERKADVYSFQIVFAGAFYFYVVVPGAAMLRYRNGLFAQQVSYGIAVAVFLQVVHGTLVNDFSSQASGLGTYIDDVVCRTDNFFVVLHHNHRITQLLQLAEHMD